MTLVEMMARAIGAVWTSENKSADPAQLAIVFESSSAAALAAIRTPPPEVIEAMARAIAHVLDWAYWDDPEGAEQYYRTLALTAWQAGIDRGMG